MDARFLHLTPELVAHVDEFICDDCHIKQTVVAGILELEDAELPCTFA